jgi:hypothetical protein
MSSIAWPRSWAAEAAARPPAWGLTALLAVAWLAVAPPVGDLAGQEYRTLLGLVLWDNGWYGGHHMPAYSVLFPPLAAAVGPRVVGAVAVVASAAAFERLARDRWGAAGRLGAVWFAVGCTVSLLTGRLTFALGFALALWAAVAATRERPRGAAALAALASLASPVAGVFVFVGALAWWIVERRAVAAAVAACGVVPAAVLTLAFPEAGAFPFVALAFWPWLIALIVLAAVLPRRERVLRVATAIYALALVASFAFPTGMGGNVTRLGALVAGPVLACALWPRRRALLLLAVAPLLWWQWVAAVDDVSRTAGDPSAEPAYYAGMLAFLDARRGQPFRVEVPFTENHWEARYVAPRHPLARGWERQLDISRNPLFYDGRPLTAERYRRWLDANAVRYVALPRGTRLDASAEAEARLVRGGVEYLRPVFRDRHWTVYAVRGPRALAVGAARAVALGPQSVDLVATRAGSVDLRVRFTPYWRIARGQGCVEPRADGWTRLRLEGPGPVRLETSFAPGRIGAREPRCSAAASM